MMAAVIAAVRAVRRASSDTRCTWQECSFSTCELTKKQQIQLLDRHDAHDGGYAATKRQQTSQGVAGDAAQGPGGPPSHLGRLLPGQAGHMQLLQVIQEAPLHEPGHTISLLQTQTLVTISPHSMKGRKVFSASMTWILLPMAFQAVATLTDKPA